MFSVITDTTSASGSPTSLLIDRFQSQVMRTYSDIAKLSKLTGLFEVKTSSPGDQSVVLPLRGKSSDSRKTKAVGQKPQETSAGTYDRKGAWDEPEYNDFNYDYTRYGDARFKYAADDVAQEVTKAIADQEKRILATLTLAAQDAAVSGYLQGPVRKNAVNGAGAAVTDYFAYSDAGAEALFKQMVQLRTAMFNRDCMKGPYWLWIVRPEVFDAYKFSTRIANIQYRAALDVQLGSSPHVDEIPVLQVPSTFWPTTNYTDQSFAKYNVDGRFAGTYGQPAAFLLNYGAGVSAIAEITPPGGGGITTQLINTDLQEVMTARVKSRYGYAKWYSDAIGMINMTQA